MSELPLVEQSKVANKPLVTILSDVLIAAGREYCAQISGGCTSLGEFSALKTLSYTIADGEPKPLDPKGELAPQLLNLLCSQFGNAEKITLTASVEGKEEKISLTLFDKTRDADQKALFAWEKLRQTVLRGAPPPMDYSEPIKSLEKALKCPGFPTTVPGKLVSNALKLSRQLQNDSNIPDVLLKDLPDEVRSALQEPLERWQQEQKQLEQQKDKPFPTRNEMQKCLQAYFDLLRAAVRQFGDSSNRGMQLFRESGDAIKSFVRSVLFYPAQRPQDAPLALSLYSPLALFVLYNAYELIEHYAGWDPDLRNDKMQGFWLGATPTVRSPKNRTYPTLEADGTEELQKSMLRPEHNDLLFRLFDHVISDRITTNLEHSAHVEGQEYLLRCITAGGAKDVGRQTLLIGRTCRPLTSRTYVPMIRLAEKIMFALWNDHLRKQEKPSSPIEIAVIGSASTSDILELWRAITNKEAWIYRETSADPKLQAFLDSLNPEEFKDFFRLQIYTPDTFSDDERLAITKAGNIILQAAQPEDPANLSFWKSVCGGEFRVAFLLDCDGIYETAVVSRSDKFYRLCACAGESTLPFNEPAHGSTANGWRQDNTMFMQAWQFLDSLDYTSEAQPNRFRTRQVDLQKLQRVADHITDRQEIFLYASGMPDETSAMLFQSDTLRITREESFGSSSMMILRAGAKSHTPNLANTDAKNVFSTHLSFSLWSLFKSFDSHFYDWVLEAELPHKDKKVKDVLKKNKEPLELLLPLMKNTYLQLDYSQLVSQKKIRYWFEYGKDVVTKIRYGTNQALYIYFDAFIKKCMAEFFCWIENDLPNPESDLANMFAQRCLSCLYYAVLGRANSVQDVFLYYALRNGSWLMRHVQWEYDYSEEEKYESKNINHEFAVRSYTDRILCWQLLNILDSPGFNLGSQRFLYSVSAFRGMHEFGQEVKSLCEKLGYVPSSLHDRSNKL
jgi:hypothetical protein